MPSMLASDIGVTLILMILQISALIIYFILYSFERDNPIIILMSLILSLTLVFKSYSVIMFDDFTIRYFPMVWVAIYGFIFFIVSAGFLFMDLSGRSLRGPSQ